MLSHSLRKGARLQPPRGLHSTHTTAQGKKACSQRGLWKPGQEDPGLALVSEDKGGCGTSEEERRSPWDRRFSGPTWNTKVAQRGPGAKATRNLPLPGTQGNLRNAMGLGEAVSLLAWRAGGTQPATWK